METRARPRDGKGGGEGEEEREGANRRGDAGVRIRTKIRRARGPRREGERRPIRAGRESEKERERKPGRSGELPSLGADGRALVLKLYLTMASLSLSLSFEARGIFLLCVGWRFVFFCFEMSGGEQFHRSGMSNSFFFELKSRARRLGLTFLFGSRREE